MSGQRSELPEPALDRSELPDRSPTGGRGTSRQQQRETKREVAEQIDVDREGVGTVDRLRGGIDVFLRSSGARQFGAQVREDFAGEADFVTPSDVAPNVDSQRIAADPAVAPDRRPTVAQRARQGTAADAQFIKPQDLDADVGRRGVSDIAIAEGRRDDVASRAREGLAADDPFAKPGDFGVDVTPTGIEDAGLTDMGARRRAGRQFESETPLGEVDPSDDLRATGDGFALREGPQRRIAATRFESDTPLGSVDPQADIEQTDSGFALDTGAQREIAALQFENQTPLGDVSPTGDVTPTGDGFGLDTQAQRRVAARNFESDLSQFDRGDLDPQSDIRSVGDGFGLGREPAREVAADDIDQQLEEFNVTPDDIELEETDDGTFEGIFERRVGG
jgi:hypothetical protein